MDMIKVRENGEPQSFIGKDAVNVFRLRMLERGLKLKIRCGIEMTGKISILKAAKATTGLKTNNKEKQLERVQLLLAQALSHVVVVSDAETSGY